MSIEDAFNWLGATAPGVYLRQSTAAFAATESLHLLSLAVVGGVVLIVDLAALRLVLRGAAVADTVRSLRPVFRGALGMVVVSGVLLVAAGPIKYLSNPLFPVKLGLLALAVTLQAWLQRGLAGASSEAADGGWRTLAAASLFLWTAVIVAGRWLGLI